MRIRNALAAAVMAATLFPSLATALPAQEQPTEAASEPLWHIESGEAVLTWPDVGPGTSYRVLHSSYATAQCAVPGRCETVAAELTDTEYRQPVSNEKPPGSKNHFWVSTCSPAGCEVPVRARFEDRRPQAYATPTAYRDGDAVELSWTPVAAADHYTVWHSAATPLCDTETRHSTCEPVATGIADTAYRHDTPDPTRNRYWIAACNAAGCAGPEGPGTSPKGMPRQNAAEPTQVPEEPPAVSTLNLTPATIHTGGTLIATLTRANATDRPEKVRLSISVPPGWSTARHQQDAICSPGECARTQTLQPGQTAQLTAHLVPSSPGRGTVTAKVTHLQPEGAPRSASLTASANVIRAPAAGQPAPPLALPPPNPTGTGHPPLPLLLGAAALAALALAGAALLHGRRRHQP